MRLCKRNVFNYNALISGKRNQNDPVLKVMETEFCCQYENIIRELCIVSLCLTLYIENFLASKDQVSYEEATVKWPEKWKLIIEQNIT